MTTFHEAVLMRIYDYLITVSTPKFPANREINREFRRIRLLDAILKADTRAKSEA
jgi:hypothetical protein